MLKTKKIALAVCYYIVAVILLATAAIVFKPSVGTDVLENGGFETGNLDGWYENFAGGTRGTSTIFSPGHSGSYALEYSLTAVGVGWYEVLQDVAVNRGSNYTVQFWYKSTFDFGKVGFFCYDQEFTKVIYSSQADFEATGNTWRFGSFQVSVPFNNQIEHTVLEITLENTIGSIVIDDIVMKVKANP